LARSKEDLDACEALIRAELAASSLYHAQQSAEKTMKALLPWHQITFRKTHDLDELKQLCLPVAGLSRPDFDEIERLSRYAWCFRYPGAPYSPDSQDAEQAEQAAADLFGSVSLLLQTFFSKPVTPEAL